ncbi:MAG: hypothetical protein DMG53_06110 [Acidobacteria bacterium]|nr:MAG: hypothetical protein DMG53_06110 [Acidobacteriota bacterium]
MNALEKNDGTLVEPDARLAQRQVTGFMNSFFFLELEPRARVELAACRLRIAFNLIEPKPPNVILSNVKNLRFGGFGVFRSFLAV